MTASNGESRLSRLGHSHHGVGESDATGWVELRSRPGSGNDFLQDTAPNVGQLADAAGVLEVDVLLVEAHEVENGRVHVADVDRLADAAQAELVGRAGGGAAGAARDVPAREFFHGLLTTDRRADEMITELTWPLRRDNTGYAFEELAQRHGDFAITAVAAEAVVANDGDIIDLSLGLGGVEDRPIVANTSAFLGKPATEETAREIAEMVAETIDPMIDLQANADYRRQLVRVLGARVLSAAFVDATAATEVA